MAFLILIHWIVIYPLESAIQSLSNLSLVDSTLRCLKLRQGQELTGRSLQIKADFFLDRLSTLPVLLKVDNSFGSLFNGSRERQERNKNFKEIKKER